MKVRFLGKFKTMGLIKGKVYEVMAIEKGWYRIMSELDEDYLFPPEHFELVTEGSGLQQNERFNTES